MTSKLFLFISFCVSVFTVVLVNDNTQYTIINIFQHTAVCNMACVRQTLL